MRLRVRVLGYTLLSLTFDAHEMLELIATEDESTQDEADPPPQRSAGPVDTTSNAPTSNPTTTPHSDSDDLT